MVTSLTYASVPKGRSLRNEVRLLGYVSAARLSLKEYARCRVAWSY